MVGRSGERVLLACVNWYGASQRLAAHDAFGSVQADGQQWLGQSANFGLCFEALLKSCLFSKRQQDCGPGIQLHPPAIQSGGALRATLALYSGNGAAQCYCAETTGLL